MGIFRQHKAARFTEDEAERMAEEAYRAVKEAFSTPNQKSVHLERLFDWACARELLARKRKENESEVV